MTKNQLTELGFHINGNPTKHQNRLYHSDTQTEFSVFNLKDLKACELVNIFYNEAYTSGTTYGEIKKTIEIQKVLGIEPATSTEKW